MNLRTIVLIVVGMAALIAGVVFLMPGPFGGGGGSIEMTQRFAQESFQCAGEFEIPIDLKNASGRDETVSFLFRNVQNIEGLRMSASQIDVDSNEEAVVEVFGKLIDGCRSGEVTVVANGMRVSGLLDVEVLELAVKGAPHNGLSPDTTGFFDSTIPGQPAVFSCCGVGFAVATRLISFRSRM